MDREILKQLAQGLIVSCQALADEPLHSSFIMGKMALAAKQGGAVAIRANSYNDIIEIKKNVSLPIIGIIKQNYPNCDVYITPTIKEIDLLIAAGVDVIAMDCTTSSRPNGVELADLVKEAREKSGNILFMADCSTIQEVKMAIELDFDIISSTLVGYTKQSYGTSVFDNDNALLKEMIKYTKKANKFFIAEGRIDTEQKIKTAMALGVDSIVVGSVITRPQLITKKFVEYMQSSRR